ncbi:GPO family capsid scaffolding protein, partial [Bilophila wadsworthia]
MSKLQTEFVKIAQSGACVDGREIKGQWLLDMAETYSPDTYTALIWPDHQRWQGNFGTVTELRAEEEGGVVSLFARLNPNERYAYVNEQRQKLFFS